MKLSKYIANLQTAHANHGDLPVLIDAQIGTYEAGDPHVFYARQILFPEGNRPNELQWDYCDKDDDGATRVLVL